MLNVDLNSPIIWRSLIDLSFACVFALITEKVVVSACAPECLNIIFSPICQHLWKFGPVTASRIFSPKIASKEYDYQNRQRNCRKKSGSHTITAIYGNIQYHPIYSNPHSCCRMQLTSWNDITMICNVMNVNSCWKTSENNSKAVQ